MSSSDSRFLAQLPGRRRLSLLFCMLLPLAASAQEVLELDEWPGESGLWVTTVDDAFAGVGVFDEWEFNAESGDRLSVRLEAELGVSRPKIRLRDLAGQTLASVDGDTTGVARLQNVLLSAPGTYRLRVYTDHEVSVYRMRVDLARGPDLEVEPNDGIAQANRLRAVYGAGTFSFRVAGALDREDAAGDFFNLGVFDPGNAIVPDLVIGAPGSLGPGDLVVRVLDATGREVAVLSGDGETGYTAADSGEHYVHVVPAPWEGISVPVAHWRLDEDPAEDGAPVADPVAGYDGTLTAAGDLAVAGVVGGAFQFGGDPDRVAIPVSGDLRMAQDFSVSFWVRPDAARQNEVLVGRWNESGNDRVWAVAFESETGILRFDTSPGGTFVAGNKAVASEPLSDGEWSHVVAIHDRAGGHNRIYIDGVERAAQPLASPGVRNSALPLYLGYSPAYSGAAQYFVGALDEVRFYSRVLDEEEIAALYSEPGLSAPVAGWNGPLRQLDARYFLTVEASDAVSPNLVATTLPDHGTASTDIIHTFTVTFSEDMHPVTVNDTANYELRNAGPDGLFGTDDDIVYTLASPGYLDGTDATFPLIDGPLQPGLHRFTAGSGLTDRAGNPLSPGYSQEFTMQRLDGIFQFETAGNESRETATPLSLEAPGGFDRSFSAGPLLAMPSNPIHVTVADLNNDGVDDVVVVNHGGSSVSVLLGNGDGTFGARVDYPVGAAPFQAAVADFNGNGYPDIAVASESPNTVSVLFNDGAGGFGEPEVYSVGSNPRGVVAGDLNGNGWADLVTANRSGHSYSVLLNEADGTGAFAPAVDVALPGNWDPRGLALGDVTGDGSLDLVLANRATNTASVHPGNGDGTFGEPVVLGAGSNPVSVAVADLTGNGFADVAVLPEGGDQLNVHYSEGGGDFGERIDWGLSASTTNYEVRLMDLDGDGHPDLVVSRGGVLTIRYNLGDGAFQWPPAIYDPGSTIRSADSGDFNADGRPDLAVVAWGNNRVTVLFGNPEGKLAVELVDGADVGLEIGAGRGNLADLADIDYWSFSGRAGWRVVLATETPGHAGGTSLNYRIERPDGGNIINFNSASNGTGQSQTTLPVDGTYYVRVARNHTYFGEYRFRVTLAPPEWQLESESNNTVGQANQAGLVVVELEDERFVRRAQLLGYLHHNDPGDFFRLGNLAEGTEIRLTQKVPDQSDLEAVLAVVDSGGNVVASEAAGIGHLTHYVDAGQEDVYYVRVTGDPRGLFSQYLLWIELEDTMPPRIVGDTLPQEDSTVELLFNHFSLSFSEDMNAASVNDVAAYELRRAATNGGFGEDDEFYTIALVSAYASGLSASYRVTDGPLRPGDYRFTVYPVLLDISNNAMEEPYVRHFTMAEVEGYVLEGRGNDSRETATTLSLEPPGDFDRSFSDGPLLGMPSNPIHVTVADLDGDGHDDLVVVNHGGSSLSVLPGNGDGTFGDRVDYPVGAAPFQAAVADFNGNGFLDVAVVSESPNTVTIFMNNGDGTLSMADTYGVGSNPRGLAIGDIDGDGVPDIVTANRSGHSYSVLLGRRDIEYDAIVSDFDDPVAQLEGWTAFGDTGNPRWEPDGGNPGGYFAVDDLAQGPTVYFSAPAGFLGDRSSSYGLPFRYDLASTTTASTFVRDDFVLEGAGLRLVYRHSTAPAPSAWTRFEVPLRAGPRWRVMNAAEAWDGDSWQGLSESPTAEQFGDVLGNLSAIFIRGEYWTGASSLGLDNVVLPTAITAIGDPTGTFSAAQEYPLPGNWDPRGVALADVTGNGNLDLVLANRATNTASVHPGNGDGTFGEPIVLDAGSNPGAVAAADLTGNGFADVAVLPEGGDQVNVHYSEGGGDFGARIDWSLSGSTTNYEVRLIDIDGDGHPDLVVSRGGVLMIRYNLGDGAFQWPPAIYDPGSTIRSADTGDFNSDGRTDLAVVAWGNNRVTVLFGNPEQKLAVLPVDEADLGLEIGTGRGNIDHADDVDYWSFSGKAGWRVVVATETPGHTSNSGLGYRIERPDGGNVLSFTASSNGTGQSQATLPVDGTYYLRVARNFTYFGEYRFRVTLAPPDWQLEAESNNTIGQSNAVNLHVAELEGGRIVHMGQILGYLHHNDAGDFFRLGNLAEGTEIRVEQAVPERSELEAVLAILNGSGAVVASSTPGGGELTHFVDAGEEDTYYIRVTGEPRGLFSQYLLWIELEDTMPPRIVADTLPEEGSTVELLFNRFSLSFSEDMDAASVNDPAAYELRRAATNGGFGANDEFYTIALVSNYSSGLGASYWVTDGPLQPGDYRLTVHPVLRDLSANTMEEPYVRHFSMAEVEGFVLEDRGNESRETATTLSLEPPGDFDRSFSIGPLLAMPSNPIHVTVADLNGNGEDDLVVVNHGAGSVSVLPGNGDGTFGARVDYPVGAAPFQAAVTDFNSNGFLDIAVASESPNTVSVLFNDGAGGFGGEPAVYAVGGNPRGVAAGDLTGNGWPDLVTPNRSGHSYSVLLNNADGSGTFAAAVETALPGNWDPRGIALGDVTGNGHLDLVLANRAANSASVHPGNGDGTFADPIVLPAGATPEGVAVGDLTGNGFADVAILPSGGDQVNVHYSAGGGNFSGQTNWSLSGSTSNYEVRFIDVDGDGHLDLVVSRGGVLMIRYNLGDGNFQWPPAIYDPGSTIRSADLGDFNGDGNPDLAVVAWGNNRVTVLMGNPEQKLAVERVDGMDLGLETGSGRGNIDHADDVDYWSFSGKAGWRVVVATETPGHTSNSGLGYRIERPDGGNVLSFTASNNGTGQSQATLPVDGTYYLRVARNFTYFGEYRFRVTFAPPEWQLEVETNNTIGQSNTAALELIDGVRHGQILGYLHHGDPGDIFRLGNLSGGTEIRLVQKVPERSDLEAVLAVLDGAGTVVASSAAGAGELTHWVDPGAEGTYFIRVTGEPRGLFSQYLLWIEVEDTMPPLIVADTLPDEGSIITTLVHSFGLTFSEDMDPSTVNDPATYDLRAAGADGLFDTAEDIVFSALPAAYTSGLQATLNIAEGVLPPGQYRFTARTVLADLAGNPMEEPYERFFDVAQVPGFTTEVEPNNTIATATPLPMLSTVPGLISGGGRGRLAGSGDLDFWSFEAEAGDRFILAAENPGNPSNSGLNFRLFGPDGGQIFSVIAANNGVLLHGPITLTEDGVYAVRVSTNWSHFGEHRLRVSLYRGIDPEIEPNNTIATATPLALSFDPETNRSTGAAGGMIRPSSDLDYFSLGTVGAGMTIFLDTRTPSHSPLSPAVSVYNSAGVYQEEVAGGRPFDGVAQVELSQTDEYFALVRANGDTGGMMSEYVLQINVLPTGDLTFPNLQVTDLDVTVPPGVRSGDEISFSFEVSNVGTAPTEVSTWFDKVVISTDTVFGNENDLDLGIYQRTGILNAGQSYTVTDTVPLPDGIQGSFYVLVMTDFTNVVEEFFLEGDNVTWTEEPFFIELAPYPDLVVENLSAGEPDNGQYLISWDTFNRGTAATARDFRERLVVRNLTTGTIAHEDFFTIETLLGVDENVARAVPLVVTDPGNYRVEVTTDVDNVIFEHDGISHETAERNTFTTGFSITQFFTVTLEASPPQGGTVSGAGTFAQGSTVTVEAVADTSELPYQFSHWAEAGIFRSANAVYSFPAVGDRHLTAVFRLPNYLIVAQANPGLGGSISGAGSHAHGSTVTLTANPNPGYLFDRWTEGGNFVSGDPVLTFTALEGRTLVAHFDEENPLHFVTTSTSPPGIAEVTGAGTYANGETGTFTAPATVVDGDTEYIFERFTLNGATVTTQNSFAKTFSTIDPAEIEYVAVYRSRSLLPVVSAVTPNRPIPVRGGVDFFLDIRFDRTMDTTVAPVVAFASADADEPAIAPATGSWVTGALPNDTFRTAPVQFVPGNDGDYTVGVSEAADPDDRTMEPAEAVYSFTVDATPPPHPMPQVTAVGQTFVTVGWAGYEAPADLNAFRFFRENAPFDSLEDLISIGGAGAGARSFNFSALAPDTEYHVAVAAVDAAGNMDLAIDSLPIIIESALPPPVTASLTAPNLTTGRLDWTGYPAATLLGFDHFRVYVEEAPFDSVSGLTPAAVLAKNVFSYERSDLDRTRNYHFAVVGVNRLGDFVPEVTPLVWSDPLSGEIEADLVAGGPEEPEIEVLQSVLVRNGVTLRIRSGTTLRFAAGAGIEVEDGQLIAEGTALAPIHLQAASLEAGFEGVVLGAGSDGSILRHVWILHGNGLIVDGAAPQTEALRLAWNNPAGLTLRNGASVALTDAMILLNGTGVHLSGNSMAAVADSVIKNNAPNAAALDTSQLDARGNWWGSSDPAAIAAGVEGNVDAGDPPGTEPVLNPAFATAGGEIETGFRTIALRLASPNVTAYRLSENSAFPGTPFVDVEMDPDSADLYVSRPFDVDFTLSEGGGIKTVFAQFFGITGAVSETLPVSVELITDGPVIQTFNLFEGQTISRPVAVQATATAQLGMNRIEFYVNGALVDSVAGATYSRIWDMRNLAAGLHRVRLVALDNAGNFAVQELNVAIAPEPPPPPSIQSPVTGTITNAPAIDVTGTAEPFVDVRLVRNAAVVATAQANAAGTFVFAGAPLAEGTNRLVATAFDSIGSTSSNAVTVELDTGPPEAVVLGEPVYEPQHKRLVLQWSYSETGERATRFRILWHDAPFSEPDQASGQTGLLTATEHPLSGLADGLYYFAVVGLDLAGNVSGLSNLVSFQYDATPPAFTIAYNKAMPVGPGELGITVTASEPLRARPTLTVRPQGFGSPIAVTLTQTTPTFFTGTYLVTALSASTGTAQVRISGTDVAGNTFAGTPSGPALVFDVTRPTGAVAVDREPPVQVLDDVEVAVVLELSRLPAPGTTPALTFTPPVGSPVAIPLDGNELIWNGTLTLAPAMGTGTGGFMMEAIDALGNSGTAIVEGGELEIYTDSLPPPPPVPTGLQATSLPGGEIRLSWNSSEGAQTYAIYREAGAGGEIPQALLIDGLAVTELTDLPPEDGVYRYAVTSERLGSESAKSAAINALSDRTPPGKPENLQVDLVAAGVRLIWDAPSEGELPAVYRVYRNGALIRSVNTTAPIVDSPPRGVMTYRVAGADAVGNENPSDPVSIELFVGAVANLHARVGHLEPVILTWTSPDPEAVGFNVYRNGIRQNASLLVNPIFQDALPIGSSPVVYSVHSQNALGQQSAARTVTVFPVEIGFRANPDEEGENRPLRTRYFERYEATVLNRDGTESWPLRSIAVERGDSSGGGLRLTSTVDRQAGPGEAITETIVFPGIPDSALSYQFKVEVEQETDVGGSRVTYDRRLAGGETERTAAHLAVTAADIPLAGGLNTFQVHIFNRGYADMDVVLVRGGGTQPGDLAVAVLDGAGEEVSRTAFAGTAPGIIFMPDGRGFLRIPPGESRVVPVPNVLVPEALGEEPSVTFRAEVQEIRHGIIEGINRVSGPLSGSMASSLTQTPYYAVAQTDKEGYSDNEPIVITGQAIDRATGDPIGQTPLKIGFTARGFTWFEEIEADAAGNFSFAYQPFYGFAGRLDIWVAHPDVFDHLNQMTVFVYRMIVTPLSGTVRMSKNDTLDFNLTLANPGDEPLNDIEISSRIYRMEEGEEVDVPEIALSLREAIPDEIRGGVRQRVSLRLQSELEAPDDALIEITFTSAEGASATFFGEMTLLPAIPILTVVSPRAGYVQGSVDRGGMFSRTVTIENRGLRDLLDVEVTLPQEVSWMQVNLPAEPDGSIQLPDIPVGGFITFDVVFVPPPDVDLGFYLDKIGITGSNAVGDFELQIAAQVTSNLVGGVTALVTNTLGQPVPNASLRMRHSVLRHEIDPVMTDSEGRVTVDNLTEGAWSWQLSAPGHGATADVVEVLADEIAEISAELFRSLVTITFNVVPVPFTDRYEIRLEMTFETFVPAPVLVMTPPKYDFHNVEPGFEATIIYTVKNEGLIKMSNVEISGSDTPYGRLIPMIDFLPELLPQQAVAIPFRLEFYGENGAPESQSAMAMMDFASPEQASAGGIAADCAVGAFVPGAFGADVFRGLAAIATAEHRSVSGAEARQGVKAIVALLAITAAMDATAGLIDRIASFLSCVAGNIFGGGGGDTKKKPRSPREPSGPNKFTVNNIGCFAAGTPVLIADGSWVPIEEIREGDRLISNTEDNLISTVRRAYTLESEELRRLTVAPLHDRAASREIFVTGEHRIWTDGRGWVAARDLTVDDWLHGPNRAMIAVLGNDRVDGTHRVFTFQLEGDSAFFAAGILAEDLCGGLFLDDLEQLKEVTE